MTSTQITSLWDQFGAALDMFQNALEKCPDELWYSEGKEYRFWYWAYHTLFWTDYYLDTDPVSFLRRSPTICRSSIRKAKCRTAFTRKKK